MDGITIEAIHRLTDNAPLHRAFNHLIAAGPGWLLAVPLKLLRGQIKGVVDGCPVPHDELLALIDSAQPRQRVMHSPMSDVFSERVNRLMGLCPSDWWFSPMRYPRGDSPVGVFSHPSSVHFAATMDVLFSFQPLELVQPEREAA